MKHGLLIQRNMYRQFQQIHLKISREATPSGSQKKNLLQTSTGLEKLVPVQIPTSFPGFKKLHRAQPVPIYQ